MQTYINPLSMSQRARKVLEIAKTHSIPQNMERIALKQLTSSKSSENSSTRNGATPAPKSSLKATVAPVKKVITKPNPPNATQPLKKIPASLLRSASASDLLARPFTIISAPRPQQSIPVNRIPPPQKYNEETIDADESEECLICLDSFKKGQSVLRLECMCKYHKDCALKWWKTSRGYSCPLRHRVGKELVPAPQPRLPLKPPTLEELTMFDTPPKSKPATTLTASQAPSIAPLTLKPSPSQTPRSNMTCIDVDLL